MIDSIDFILVIILLSALLSLGSSRMMALVKLMALQGAMVSLVPISLEQHGHLSNNGVIFYHLYLWDRQEGDLRTVKRVADYLLGQNAVVLLISIVYIVLTLLADVANAWLDPRIRIG